MTKEGIVTFKSKVAAFRTHIFSYFVDDLLNYINTVDISNAVVAMDNVPFHNHYTIKIKYE